MVARRPLALVSGTPAELPAGDDVIGSIGAVTIGLGNGSDVLSTGVQLPRLQWPFAGVLLEHSLVAKESGSIVIDIWKDSYANWPPTNADTITASAKPTLSSAAKGQDATLTGWTKSFAKGDFLLFNVDSVTTITAAWLTLRYQKTG